MRWIASCVSILAGVMGMVSVAVAGNGGVSPIIHTPVMIAQASQAHQSGANVERTIGICQMISNPKTTIRTNQNLISPVVATRGYFNSFEDQVVAGASNVAVLQKPAHGTLEDLGTLATDQNGKVLRDTGERKYYYRPDPSYVGQDSAILLVEMGGRKVQINYFLHVFEYSIEDSNALTQELCPNGEYIWKISSINR